MPIDFLAIGELLADVITTDYCDDLSQARTFQMFQGGSPSNVAANLQWLGKNAGIVACVGNDGIGRFLVSEIQKTGISTEFVQASQYLPTSLVLVTRSKGTPDFIAYRAADTQIGPLPDELIASSKILHTTAFALSRLPARISILDAFGKARQMKKVVSADWNFAPAIWGNDDGVEVFEQLMNLEPVIKFSLDDMDRFTGIKTVSGCKEFLGKYSATVCLTAGKDGVHYRSPGGDWHYAPALPVNQVVDTTGAGDAFWAGFHSAAIDGREIDDCVEKGLEIAAKKVEQQGPLYFKSEK